MNHTYIPYDLVINEPRLAPGTVVRLVNPKQAGLDGAYPDGAIGVVQEGGKVLMNERPLYGGATKVWWTQDAPAWEPIPADDPANIYPGDRVVCVEDRHKGIRDWTGELANVVKRDNQLYMKPAYLLTNSAVTPQNSLFSWAILEPAVTPLAEIEEGDEVVCRVDPAEDCWDRGDESVPVLGCRGVVDKRRRVNVGDRSCYLKWQGRQWLVTKKATTNSVDELTTEEQDRLGTLIYGYALGRALRPVDIGHIIDDCIKRGWAPDYLGGFSLYEIRGSGFTETHPYTLIGIARAYLEARERWG